MAVPHTSPSPCVAWPSPIENRAPGTKTGRNSVEPATRWRVSMLPPWTSGGIVLSGPLSGRDTHLATERGQRHVDPRPVLGQAARSGDRGDLVERGGEVVGKQPEAGDVGGPAPVRRLELEDVDLERVARLGAGDLDRAVDLVDLVEDERLEVGGDRIGGQLSVRRVEAVEPDDVARRDRRDRWDRRVPGEVRRVTGDMDGRRVEHGRASSAVCGGSRSPASRPSVPGQAGVAGAAGVAGVAGATSSVSPIASRTERSLSRSRNQK